MAFHTLAKYLQGVSTGDKSVECENGHAFPAWHCPVLKNLQGTWEVSDKDRVSLFFAQRIVGCRSTLLVFEGLLGPSNAPMLTVPRCREVPLGMGCGSPFGTGKGPFPLV